MLVSMNGAFVALLVIGVALAIDLTGCKKDCNDLSEDNSKVLFYGTDEENHLITYSKTSGTAVMKCYRTCGVTAVYPGLKGCPNYCSSYYGQGHCWEGVCECNDGWTGPDCSIVTCPNSCSDHGVCVNGSCQCEPGYFSNDCSSPIVSLGSYPFGQWVNDRPYYSPTDKYRDSHPVFNTSTISQFRITMSDDDLQYLLLPENQYDQKYVECTITFQNQVISETRQAGIRLKGQSTPEYLKKGWKINFLKYGEESFFGLDYVGLKYPYPDDSMMRNQLYMDLNRAFNVPVFRASYATLWINDIYRGVYWLQEEMDENFIQARYEFPNGNFYRNGAPGAFFGYLGDNPETYKNLSVFNRGELSNVYEQESGNGYFDDLTQFIQVLNISNNRDFAEKIVQVFDVDRYLRALAVEVFTINTDSYHRNGNNWCLYKNPETDLFEFFGHDFDFAMRPSNGVEGFVYNDSSVKAVLSVRLLEIPEFRNNYTNYLEMIMNLNLTQLFQRTETVKDLIFPQLKEDLFYRLDWGRTDQSFFDDKEYVNSFFPRRSDVVRGQLENFSSKRGFGMSENVEQGSASYLWIVLSVGGAFAGIVIGTIVLKRRKNNNYDIIKG